MNNLLESIKKTQEDLLFEEVEHKYTRNGIVFPSVTQIMKPLYDNVYGGVSEAISEQAKAKGRAIHKAVEFYNEYRFVDIEEHQKGYLEAYIQWLKEYEIKVLASEVMLIHPWMFYGGTLDLICEQGDKLILVDVKTGTTVPKLHAIQLQAYASMWEANSLPKIQEIYTLNLKDGDFVFEKFNTNESISKTIFNACYKINQYLNA